ncbi:MAG: holo-ACP synthase [Clostridiales bacterium]|nr:holo-ACP synthase [Clostridiales bacterium]
MIAGIGTDIIEIRRVARAARNERFLRRCFSDAELQGSAASLAGNFAAKEAVVKALGCGFAGFWPRDVAILRDARGAPYVSLSGEAKRLAAELGSPRILVTLAHCGEYAVAYAVSSF